MKNSTRRSPRASFSVVTGFTIIELMIIVTIVGILAALAIPNVMSMGRTMMVMSEVRQLYGGLAEARTRAVQTTLVHRLRFDRSNNRWEIWFDKNGDGTFFTDDEEMYDRHELSTLVAFGPEDGFPQAFDVPYAGVARASWCTPCGASSATNGYVEFDIDGQLTSSSSGAIASGSISLVDASRPSTGRVAAVIVMAVTGDLKIAAAR